METTEYERAVEAAFADAPFRLEFRAYPPESTSGQPGVWQMMHRSNGAIITTGKTPLEAVESLKRMADRMDSIRAGLPSMGRLAR